MHTLGTTSGSYIVQRSFDNSNNQKFRLIDEGSGYYSFRPLCDESLRVDVSNAADTNGARIKLFVNNPSYGSQKFKFDHKGNNKLTIMPYLSSSKVLEVSASSIQNDAAVQLYTYSSTVLTMHWYLEEASVAGIETNETYYIRNHGTGRYLSVEAGTVSYNSANVSNNNFSAVANKKWIVTKNSDNTYTLKTSYNINYMLDANGDNIDIWDNYPPDQKFIIERSYGNNNNGTGGYYIKIHSKYMISNGYNTVLSSSVSPSDTNCLWSFEKVNHTDATYIYSPLDLQGSDIGASKHRTVFRNLGFSAYTERDTTTASTGLNWLQTDDIFVHNIHGAQDCMQFYSNGSHSFLYGSQIRSLQNNALNNIRLFISFGCSVGKGDPPNNLENNIVYSIYQKGASISIGWTDTNYTPYSGWWYEYFLDYINTKQYGVSFCAMFADSTYMDDHPNTKIVSDGERVIYGEGLQIIR